MLYEILNPLTTDVGPLRLFGFITFHTGGAVVTALFISFILGHMGSRSARVVDDSPPERPCRDANLRDLCDV